MGRRLRDFVLSASMLIALNSPVFGEEKEADNGVNSLVEYHENIDYLNDKNNSSPLLQFILSPDRVHYSIGDHRNVKFLKGTDEEYNPLRFKLGFEYDSDFSVFNRFSITPFIGRLPESGRDYDVGTDFKFKKIVEGKKWNPFFYLGFGAIYIKKNLNEHKYKGNFNLNTGIGVEYKLDDGSALTFAFDYDHVSNGKKFWNTLRHLTPSANNEGNPGLNTFGLVIGYIF